MSEPAASRSRAWRWYVCILLLFATTINYMDRQTLATTAKRVKAEFSLSNEQYGNLETGFSLAFATGSLFFGILADRVNVRFLYPAVLVLWSIVGFATGLSKSYTGLLVCRTALGLFEAGHWPCALKTVQRIHERKDRAMGNSLLQSGSSIGAIITPILVQRMLEAGTSWRIPYMVVGGVGMVWALFWLITVRSTDLAQAPPEDSTQSDRNADAPAAARDPSYWSILVMPRFLSLMVMVSFINMSWQLLRAWMPLFLQEGRHYTEAQANYFTPFYFGATDVGVLTAGFATRLLARRGISVHASRCWVFLGGSLLTLLTLVAARQPQGLLLLGLLLVVGAGLLGVFPSYYSFTQEISVRHQGKVTGTLGVCAWVSTAIVQKSFGRYIDLHKSYDLGIALSGVAPILALGLLVLLWKRGTERKAA